MAAPPLIKIDSPGSEAPIAYAKFGHFVGAGTPDYKFVIDNFEGLADAAGEGIYPNERSLAKDPRYYELQNEKALLGPPSDFLPFANPELAFYKWASLKGTPYKGLRLFNIARSLELGGQPRHAIKAYYAIVIHFPKEVSWQGGRPWYLGMAALDAIDNILFKHPEWNISLEGAQIKIINAFDRKSLNDVFFVDPGTWVSKPAVFPNDNNFGDIKTTIGQGKTQIVQRNNGHWQFMVEGKPYVIRGMCYSPTPVGRSPDLDGYKPNTDWLYSDQDGNGKIDGPADAWLDINRNSRKDSWEKEKGDFYLMRDMGVNTLRLYHHGDNKVLLRELLEKYQIRILMGDLLGAYAVGSDAAWDEGRDYTDPAQCERMMASVRQMVELHMNEPYVLMWVLGNENNYGHGNNADKNPLAYYRFANAVAKMVHEIDPGHPVALSNGELEFLDVIARECPDVDVLALNAYRGPEGMGTHFWDSLKEVWRKPVFIGEFGCPAFNSRYGALRAEKDQASYLLGNWTDIVRQTAGSGRGHCLGGSIFEWVDEWWKAGPEFEAWVHDTDNQVKGPFPDGFMYEEWLGVMSQGDGRFSPFLRQPRLAFYKFKNGPWKRETQGVVVNGKKRKLRLKTTNAK